MFLRCNLSLKQKIQIQYFSSSFGFYHERSPHRIIHTQFGQTLRPYLLHLVQMDLLFSSLLRFVFPAASSAPSCQHSRPDHPDVSHACAAATADHDLATCGFGALINAAILNSISSASWFMSSLFIHVGVSG